MVLPGFRAIGIRVEGYWGSGCVLELRVSGLRF